MHQFSLLQLAAVAAATATAMQQLQICFHFQLSK